MTRLALVLAALAVALFGAAGCVDEACVEGDPRCVAVGPRVEYLGEERTIALPYVAGRSLQVTSRKGQVDVVPGGAELSFAFQPFTRASDDQVGEDEARAAMVRDLVVEVIDGDPIEVRIAKVEGASADLGAHLTIALPPGFDGGFLSTSEDGSVEADLRAAAPRATAVVSDRGKVEVLGARGATTLLSRDDDVVVSFASWGTAEEPGRIEAPAGAVDLAVPAAADGVLVLVAGGSVDDAALIGARAEDATGITWTLGPGEGARVDVIADGDVVARTE